MKEKVLIYCRQIKAVNNPIAVSYRNATILANDLGADILMSKKDKLKHSDYDVIILPYFNRYTDYNTLRRLVKSNQSRWLVVICFQIVFFDRLHTEYPRAILSITDSYNENYKEKKCGNLSVKAPA